MMKQLSVHGLTSLVKLTGLLLIAFVPFTVHCSLSAAYADEIRSRAAIVMEASTGRILYGKNPNLRLLPASTAKLMTAMVALDRANPEDTVVISERSANCSPVKARFRVGERVTVETLLNAALIKSANDAAVALAEGVAESEEEFVRLMNEKVLALGMSDTRFINATGLPGEGQYITVYDLARMLRQALRYPLIKDIISTKASHISTEGGREIFIKNSNYLLWADDSVLGGKTGYTRAAKHCFVCASEQDGETIITGILGAPTRGQLWKESEHLIEKGFAILAGKEEPALYFTKSDYRSSIEPATYRIKPSHVREVSHKKIHKRTSKKKIRRSKAKSYVDRYKTGGGTHADVKRGDGDEG